MVQVSWLLKQAQAQKPEATLRIQSTTFPDEQNAATLNDIPFSLVVKLNKNNTPSFSQEHLVSTPSSLQKDSTTYVFEICSF